MRTRSIIALGAIVVLVLFVVSCLPVADAQDTKKGTITLGEDEYDGFETDKVDKDVPITIEFDTDGDVPIDAYIFNETNYNRYRTGAQAIAEKSFENTAHGRGKYTTDKEGVYYVVFDNTDYDPADPQGSVTVHYKVTLDEDDPGLDTYMICGALIAGFIIIVFIKVKMKKKKRAKEALASAGSPMQTDPNFAIGPAPQATGTAAADGSDSELCPVCGNESTYIEQYKRHYCYNCKEYTKTEAPVVDGSESRSCPKCGNECKYIEQYERHYCYNCEKYLE